MTMPQLKTADLFYRNIRTYNRNAGLGMKIPSVMVSSDLSSKRMIVGSQLVYGLTDTVLTDAFEGTQLLSKILSKSKHL
jgi:hypothetical protein